MNAPTNMPTQSNPLSDPEAILRLGGKTLVYRFFGAFFSWPQEEIWSWLSNKKTLQALGEGIRLGWSDEPELFKQANEFILQFKTSNLEDFRTSHSVAFGFTVNGDCPPYEIEYGDFKADALFRPHRLADLGAFYNAFGLEMEEEAFERIDHLAIECEFFSALIAKEAHAIEKGDNASHVEISHDAQKQFLREHIGRWTPAFARRLKKRGHRGPLTSGAALLSQCVVADCTCFQVKSGEPDLELRPIQEKEELLNMDCGISCPLSGAPSSV